MKDQHFCLDVHWYMWFSVFIICQLLILSWNYRQSFTKNLNNIVQALQWCFTETAEMTAKDWTSI